MTLNLNLAQIASDFDRDGYVIVENFASSGEVAAAREAMQHAVAQAKSLPNPPERVYFQVETFHTQPRLNLDVPAIRALRDKPELHQIANAIVGPDAKFINVLSQVYMPHAGHRQSWHTDSIARYLPACFVTCLVYLQDQNTRQGLTRVVPGSHHTPLDKAFDPHADLSGQVAVEVPAGTLCAFQSTIWHSGSENHSDQPRYLLGFRFEREAYQQDHSWQKIAAHALGFRRFGKPIFDMPCEDGSYPWPQSYAPGELPWL